MTILHGLYDHGKIEIIEKNPPEIKAEVEVRIVKKPLPQKNEMSVIKKYKGIAKNSVKIEKDQWYYQ
ncbi:MAG: hypothetical protein A2Y33_12560 [Spirochaetes bacterium GWF1_51_8]|nr:MAG: hypothetical protein A2Y33_12560 [Spirochaetes bacterium GWF1_51_8]